MLKIEDFSIGWDFGEQFACDILRAIEALSSKGIKHIDGEGFKAYWAGAGTILRIDIEQNTLV